MTVIEQQAMNAVIGIAKEVREMNQPKSIDWEQRRYELVKAAFAEMVNSTAQPWLVEACLEKADEMIAALKRSTPCD